jgi:hypothetical protein
LRTPNCKNAVQRSQIAEAATIQPGVQQQQVKWAPPVGWATDATELLAHKPGQVVEPFGRNASDKGIRSLHD